MSRPRPPSPRQTAGRRSSADVSQAQRPAPDTMSPMRFKTTIRRIDSSETIELAGFIRLTAHGTEQPAEIGRMPAGSLISWQAATWEIV